MDVRCPACSVEYEFDDDKVTAAGVTVKCTSCQHVFKVKKGGAAPALDMPDAAPTGAPTSTEWMIRQADGRTFKFKELTTLQKWIVEQKVSRSDQISRTGQSWKSLGEIAELASFFQVVDAARAAQQMAAQPQGYPSQAPGMPGSVPPQYGAPGSHPPGSHPPGSHPPGSLPPGSLPPGSLPPGAYSSRQSYPPGSHPPGSHPPGSLPPGYPPQGYPPQYPPQGYPQGVPGQQLSPPQGAPAAFGQATGQYAPGHRPTLETVFNPGAMPIHDGRDGLDDDDPVAQWQKRGRRRKWLVVLALLIGGGAGTLYAVQPELVKSWLAEVGLKLDGLQSKPPPELATAAGALAGTDDDVKKANALLAGPVAAQHPDALALSSRLTTARARHARWGLFILQAAGDDPPLEARQQIDSYLHKAYELAGKAMAQGASPRAHLANADYQAARGGLAEMEADLKVSAQDPTLQREIAVVRALGHTDFVLLHPQDQAAQERLNAALSDAAVPREDRRILTATVVARAATGSSAKALDADLKALQVIEGVGGIATQLGARLAKGPLKLSHPVGTPGGKPGEPVSGGGKAPDRDASEGKPTGGSKGDDDDDDKTTDQDNSGPSYSSLMARGKRSLMAGRSSSALSAYKSALRAKPGSDEAQVGMGWALLDLGRTSSAIRSFKKAPGLADAHLGLGEAYRADGNNTEALKHFKKYLALAPNGPDATVAKRAIKQLQ